MTEQLSHTENSFQRTEFPIVLLLDNITGEANLGSIFRLADAFGIQKLLFCGTPPNLNSNRLKRTARNTYNTVDFEFRENGITTIESYKKKGFRSVAVEITSTSKPMHEFKLKGLEKILLIAGNERHGVSAEVLDKCSECYHIEMFGENSSMNVAQSVGIALYEITKALNKFAKK